VKLHEQRSLQTHRHAMFALDVSQINRRTTDWLQLILNTP
jgi:hypothetical protein